MNQRIFSIKEAFAWGAQATILNIGTMLVLSVLNVLALILWGLADTKMRNLRAPILEGNLLEAAPATLQFFLILFIGVAPIAIVTALITKTALLAHKDESVPPSQWSLSARLARIRVILAPIREYFLYALLFYVFPLVVYTIFLIGSYLRPFFTLKHIERGWLGLSIGCTSTALIVYLFLRYNFVGTAIIDTGCGLVGGFRKNQRLTTGVQLKLFLFYFVAALVPVFLLFVLFPIFGPLALEPRRTFACLPGVLSLLLLFGLPVLVAAHVYVYKKLQEQQDATSPRQPTTEQQTGGRF